MILVLIPKHFFSIISRKKTVLIQSKSKTVDSGFLSNFCDYQRKDTYQKKFSKIIKML